MKKYIIRIPCKEGYIENWMGDSGDHPDNEKSPSIQLNSSLSLWRLHGQTEWIEQSMFDKIHYYIQFADTCTADEIWDASIKK